MPSPDRFLSLVVVGFALLVGPVHARSQSESSPRATPEPTSSPLYQ
ncbi:MAG: hypothetical protein ABEL97_06780 [Salinibacter sp.]